MNAPSFPEGFQTARNVPTDGENLPPAHHGVIQGPGSPDKPAGDCPDEGVLDQLVDGELSLAQQQEVLQHLQTHPEGWRRLALAFLEAQTWRQEMPRLVQTPIAHPPQPVLRPASTRRNRIPAWQMLALAGGVLIAFLGGYWTRDFWPGLRNSSPEGFLVQGSALPQQERKPHSEADWLKETPGYSRREFSSGWEYVTLTDGRGPDGVPEVVRVPVSPTMPESRLAPSGPPIPEELLDLLRRWGAEVSHSREFVPLRIEDGRQVVVPVEQVELYHRAMGERYQ